MNEPKITINGIELTVGQSMTVRVALLNYQSELTCEPFPLGDDERGKAMTKAYRDRMQEIQTLMINPAAD